MRCVSSSCYAPAVGFASNGFDTAPVDVRPARAPELHEGRQNTMPCFLNTMVAAQAMEADGRWRLTVLRF